MQRQKLTEIERVDVYTMSRRKVIRLTLIGVALCMMVLGAGNYFIREVFRGMDLLVAISFLVAFVILHELAHGIAFYLYTGKVKFGVKWRTRFGVVAYASSPNSILTKWQMIITALAPQIMTILIIAISPMIYSISTWLSLILVYCVGLNLGGGVADLYCVCLLLKQKGEIFAEDIMTGMIIYRRGEV